MIRFIFPFLLLATGCVQVQDSTDKTARSTATKAVTEAIYTRFPQVPKALIEPFTTCIIDGATGSEINSLAQDAVFGVHEGTATVVRTILARPATKQCLTAAAPSAAAIL